MAITPNMTLDLPSVSVTLGPEWATLLNAAFALIDSHDHSDGKGVKVTPLGLNINSNLDINDAYLVDVGSMRLTSQSSTLVTASDLRSLYSVLGNLYYNNSSGVPIQLTSGSSVTAASDGVSRQFSRTSVASNTIIGAAGTTSYYDVDTTSSVTFTLPSAAGVSAGRFYEFKDTTGSAATNNIIIQRAGSDTIDGATSVTVNTAYGGRKLISDGVSKWSSTILVSSQVQTANIENLAVSTAKIAAGAVTPDKRAALGQQLSTSTGSLGSLTAAAFTDITSLTVTITTTGRPIFVGLVPDGSTNLSLFGASISGAGAGANIILQLELRLKRGGTVVYQSRVASHTGTANSAGSGNLWLSPSSFSTIEVLAAGTYTYQVDYRAAASNSCFCDYTKLIAYEL